MWVWPFVILCVYVVSHWLTTRKQTEIELPFFFHHFAGLAHDRDLLFEGQRLKSRPFWLCCKRWQIVQTLLLATKKFAYGFFDWHIYIWPWLILKFKIMHFLLCKCLTNGNRLTIIYYCYQIWSPTLAINWHICLWPWLIEKVQGHGHLQFDCEKFKIAPCILLYVSICCPFLFMEGIMHQQSSTMLYLSLFDKKNLCKC